MGFNPQQGVWENVGTKVLLSIKKKEERRSAIPGVSYNLQKTSNLFRKILFLFGLVLQSTRQYTKATIGLFWTHVVSMLHPMHRNTGH